MLMYGNFIQMTFKISIRKLIYFLIEVIYRMRGVTNGKMLILEIRGVAGYKIDMIS